MIKETCPCTFTPHLPTPTLFLADLKLEHHCEHQLTSSVKNKIKNAPACLPLSAFLMTHALNTDKKPGFGDLRSLPMYSYSVFACHHTLCSWTQARASPLSAFLITHALNTDEKLCFGDQRNLLMYSYSAFAHPNTLLSWPQAGASLWALTNLLSEEQDWMCLQKGVFWEKTDPKFYFTFFFTIFPIFCQKINVMQKKLRKNLPKKFS